MNIPLFHDIASRKRAFAGLFGGLLLVLAVYEVGSQFAAMVLNGGLRRYYCLDRPAEILCIGHSMSEMGIDKVLMEKRLRVPVAKYCINGVSPEGRNVLLLHYLETVGKAPKILVYDVSGRIFSAGLSVNSYQLLLPFITESAICRESIRQYVSPREQWFWYLNPLQRYDITRLGAAWRGYRGDWQSRKMTQFDPADFRRKMAEGKFWRISMEDRDIAALQRTIRLCREHGILCVLAALPCVDLLNDSEPEKYAQVMALLKKFAAENDHVRLFDYNPAFSHRYELFADPIHVRPEGQKLVTEALARDLAGIIGGNR